MVEIDMIEINIVGCRSGRWWTRRTVAGKNSRHDAASWHPARRQQLTALT
jgi:hypothetical protein